MRNVLNTILTMPWKKIAHFHHEVVLRGQDQFAAFPAQGGSDRCHRLNHSVVDGLEGPWSFPLSDLPTGTLRDRLSKQSSDVVYIGGPCILDNGKQGAFWRPLLYRPIIASIDDGIVTLSPASASWDVGPIVVRSLESLQVQVSMTTDDLSHVICEAASRSVIQGGTKTTLAVIQAIHGLDKRVAERIRLGRDPAGNPWVIFAPQKQHDSYNQRLGQDYIDLIGRLSQQSSDLGGLAVFDQSAAHLEGPLASDGAIVDALHVVPLAPSQREALDRVLAGAPLTVVSGPPGTGKSQVVVSLLVNAWAQGLSVLFVSNNNKAVDVVMERISKIQEPARVALRSGNLNVNTVADGLKHIQQLAALKNLHSDGDNPTQDRQQLTAAEKNRSAIRARISSGHPRRLEEDYTAALTAYGSARQEEAALAEHTVNCRKGLDGSPGAQLSDDRNIAIHDAIHNWLNTLPAARAAEAADEAQRENIEIRLDENWQHLRSALSSVAISLSDPEAADTGCFIGASVRFHVWRSRVAELLSSPLERQFEPKNWNAVHDRWSSAQAAGDWLAAAEAAAQAIRAACIELLPITQELGLYAKDRGEIVQHLASVGLPPDATAKEETIQAWESTFAASISHGRRPWDWWPWSEAANRERHLRRIEGDLRAQTPIALWIACGRIDAVGRQKLADRIAVLRQVVLMQRRWSSAGDLERRRQTLIGSCATRISNLGPTVQLPSTPDPISLQVTAEQIDVMCIEARQAVLAWRMREEREAAEQDLLRVASTWDELACTVPPLRMAAPVNRTGVVAAMDRIRSGDFIGGVQAMRSAQESGILRHIEDALRSAGVAAEQREALHLARQQLAPVGAHRSQWWISKPADPWSHHLGNGPAWLNEKTVGGLIAPLSAWRVAYRELEESVAPSLRKRMCQFDERAATLLQQALSMAEDIPATMAQEVCTVLEGRSQSWPLDRLAEIFRPRCATHYRLQLDGLDADTARLSLRIARIRWHERARQDTPALQAIDRLHRHKLAKRQFVLEDFRAGLRLAPIWVSTAQSTVDLPLAPSLFDMVVIDEASQCTLTNLLPIIYRGKRLIVIGDENQLTAITSIGRNVEQALARQHDLEDDAIQRFGHVDNTVYKCAINTLPRRLADAVQLCDHFRSKPLIIGFSNRHIYHQRLQLRRQLPASTATASAAGVSVRRVSGSAVRTDGSWANPVEAKAVTECIRELLTDPAYRSCSIGVVTPFKAQAGLILSCLAEIPDADQVLVGTAHTFQGDERDIVIFSPVAAPGIEPAAMRWISSPPNLVNVALTRARDLLVVIGDIDYLRSQDGILRELACYCSDIEKLDKSPAELVLFSLLVGSGWDVRVHPRIGDIEPDFSLHRHAHKLAIEVDGREHHDHRQAQDHQRDAFLRSSGYDVLRISPKDVFERPASVLQRIDDVMT